MTVILLTYLTNALEHSNPNYKSDLVCFAINYLCIGMTLIAYALVSNKGLSLAIGFLISTSM